MKKFCIINGTLRPQGHTSELLKPFIAELKQREQQVEVITLFDKNIHSCVGCYHCQSVLDSFGCAIDDDAVAIMDSVIACDCLVLATPIYTWLPTAPLKALIDRFYALSKYSTTPRGSLWRGKNLALIATHGDQRDSGVCDFWVGAVKNLCQYAGLNYQGIFSWQDNDGLADFQTPQALAAAQAFAKQLCEND